MRPHHAVRSRFARCFVSVFVTSIVTLSPALSEDPSFPLAEAELSARSYLETQRAHLGLDASDVENVVVTNAYLSRHTGARHAYVGQTWRGLEIHGGNLALTWSNTGEVAHVGDRLVRGVERRAPSSIVPEISAVEAVVFATEHLSLDRPEALVVLEATQEAARNQLLTAGGISIREIPARLVWVEDGEHGALGLAWNLEIEPAGGLHSWSVRIDAANGELLDLTDRVDWDSYRVYPVPIESPNHTMPAPPSDGRALVVDPHLAGSGSPFGWHDTDGMAGAEHDTTQGNNAIVFPDRDGNSTGTPVDCGSTRTCDFTLDLGMATSTYSSAASANLFYWTNILHDVLYEYGFDEPAGNFQTNNYGNGGTAADPAYGLAQFDGDGTFRCNANFSTLPDGMAGTMRVGICNNTTPWRDVDLDGLTIAHEYAHGLSNRLVGGPSNVDCLENAEQMGEGWSDYLGLFLTTPAGPQATDLRPVFTYWLGNPVAGPGSRPAPYTVVNTHASDPDNLLHNPYDYSDLSTLAVPHGVGFLWAQMLWEMQWKLVEEHGFNPDVYGAWSSGGNNLALQLVVDGLKMQACSPGFTDGRGAILAADSVLTSGANQCSIWYAFAKRGLGEGASQGSPTSIADGTHAFDLPEACNGVTTAAATAATCVGSEGDPAQFVLTVESIMEAEIVPANSPALPVGLSLEYQPNPLSGPLPADMTLSVSQDGSLPVGSYPFEARVADAQGVQAKIGLTLDVVDTIPVAPDLLVPADGATDQPLRPQFEWTTIAGDSFTLEIDDDPAFGSPEASVTLSNGNLRPPITLEPETTYYWRVRASVAPCGVDSSIFSFETAALSEKLIAPVPAPNDALGTSVDQYGDLVAVGAPGRGSAILFAQVTDGVEWIPIVEVSGSPGEQFGTAVALAASRLVVGAPGAAAGEGRVYVYERNEGGPDNWGLESTLSLPGSESFGAALDVDKDTVVVGAPLDDSEAPDAGRAAVFRRTGPSNWSLEVLDPLGSPDAGGRIGTSVAISRDHVAVGSPLDNYLGTTSGSVRIFTRDGASSWTQTHRFGPVDGTPDNSELGSRVALDADNLLIASWGDGTVRMLSRHVGGPDVWGDVQEIVADDDAEWQSGLGPSTFGTTLAIHGDLALIGRNGPVFGGAVHLYQNSGVGPDPWVEVERSGPPDWPSCGYGEAAAIHHGSIVVGSLCDDPDTQSAAGSAYHLRRAVTGWSEEVRLTPSSVPDGDYAQTLAVDGDTLVVAAPDSHPDDNSSPFVYTRDGAGGWHEVARLVPIFNSDSEGFSDYGFSVAVQGDLAVVGAPEFQRDELLTDGNTTGAVFVFARNAGGPDAWGEIARLLGVDEHGTSFGYAVDLDGDVLVVGDPRWRCPPWDNQCGRAYVFQRHEGGTDNWGLVAELFNHDVSAWGGIDSRFGIHVDVDGGRIAVGAQDDVDSQGLGDETGSVYLYERHLGGANAWGEVTRLAPLGLQHNAFYGSSFDLDGDRLAVFAFSGERYFVHERNLDGENAWGVRTVLSIDGDLDLESSGRLLHDRLWSARSGPGFVDKGVVSFRRNLGGTEAWGLEDQSLFIEPDPPETRYAETLEVSAGQAAVGYWRSAAYLFRLDGTWPAEPPRPPTSVIFFDGFESGDTSAWSSTTP